MHRTVQPAQPRATAVSIIAWVQFISAAITAVLMLIFAGALSDAVNGAVYLASLAVFGSFIWLPGLCLMCGYWLFATRCHAPASSTALWLLSLIFNFPSLVIISSYLIGRASQKDGPESLLLILPPLIGTVLGVLGMIAVHLESKR